jgi:hypothetical protein
MNQNKLFDYPLFLLLVDLGYFGITNKLIAVILQVVEVNISSPSGSNILVVLIFSELNSEI